MVSRKFLEVNEEDFREKLLLHKGEDSQIESLFPPVPEKTATVMPKPGICIKTKDEKQNKVFINICTSEIIPEPEDISSNELLDILDSDTPSNFRVPMSIGPPHEENDKSGNKCVAYDIIIHPNFLSKVKDNPLFHNFFVIASMEGLENKYLLTFEKKDWTVLKNKTYHGTVPHQLVKTPLPYVQELTKNQLPSGNKVIRESPGVEEEPLICEISSKSLNISTEKGSLISAVEEPQKKPAPKHTIKEIEVNSRQNLQIDVELPYVGTGKQVNVDIGEDCLVVETENYFLDLTLQQKLNINNISAYFVTSMKVLRVIAAVTS